LGKGVIDDGLTFDTLDEHSAVFRGGLQAGRQKESLNNRRLVLAMYEENELPEFVWRGELGAGCIRGNFTHFASQRLLEMRASGGGNRRFRVR
jgi:hypothetical protein